MYVWCVCVCFLFFLFVIVLLLQFVCFYVSVFSKEVEKEGIELGEWGGLGRC